MIQTPFVVHLLCHVISPISPLVGWFHRVNPIINNLVMTSFNLIFKYIVFFRVMLICGSNKIMDKGTRDNNLILIARVVSMTSKYCKPRLQNPKRPLYDVTSLSMFEVEKFFVVLW